MKRRIERIDLSVLAPLVLFAMLATCVLIVLLTGADVYRSFTDQDSASNTRRSVTQYLSTRVRQSSSDGAFFVGDFHTADPAESGDTYFIREVYGDIEYYTRVYCHDGYLYELFSGADYDAEPSDGERIVPLEGLSFSISEGALRIDVSLQDGGDSVLYFDMAGEAHGR